MATKEIPSNGPTDSRGSAIAIAIAATYCIALIALVLRTIARRLSKGGLWLDDWLIYASTVRPFTKSNAPGLTPKKILYTAILGIFLHGKAQCLTRWILVTDPSIKPFASVLDNISGQWSRPRWRLSRSSSLFSISFSRGLLAW